VKIIIDLSFVISTSILNLETLAVNADPNQSSQELQEVERGDAPLIRKRSLEMKVLART